MGRITRRTKRNAIIALIVGLVIGALIAMQDGKANGEAVRSAPDEQPNRTVGARPPGTSDPLPPVVVAWVAWFHPVPEPLALSAPTPLRPSQGHTGPNPGTPA